MRVTDEDYALIREFAYGFMVRFDSVDESDERNRWDAFWSGTVGWPSVRARLVSQYSDAHLDTALRKLQREVRA